MRDIRYALRLLSRTPGVTATAVLALALGIGANTAMFTVVNSVLLRPLPYDNPDRLVWLFNTSLKSGATATGMSGFRFQEYRRASRSFERMAGFLYGTFTLTGDGEPERLLGARITDGFFETLGVQPLLGRTFRADEQISGRNSLVILGNGLWLRRFGGNPSIIGKTVTLDGGQFLVAGVMPAGFQFPPDCDLWAPAAYDSPLLTNRMSSMLRGFARLKTGVGVPQAQADVSAVSNSVASGVAGGSGGNGIRLVTFTEDAVGNIRPTLLVFVGSVAFVLLIACANVANLLLARAASREKEMAIRTAVGGTRSRLVSQLLTESGILALLGGAVGIALAWVGLHALLALGPRSIPRLNQIALDARALAFTLVLSVGTGLLFGLVPSLRASAGNLQETLKEGSRGSSGGVSARRWRAALVIGEVALAFALLLAAGLLARSFDQLLQVRPGFQSSGVLALQITLSSQNYMERQRRTDFFERLMGRIRAIPGVEDAGAVHMLPLGGQNNMAAFWLDPGSFGDMASRLFVNNRVVLPGYFSTLRIPMTVGRDFDWRDRQGAPNAMVVNDAFARRFFPLGDAVGKRITLDTGSAWTAEIVGVAGSIRNLDLAEPARPEVYTTFLETPLSGLNLVVRTAGDPAAVAGPIRDQVRALDKDLPIYNVRPLTRLVDNSLSQSRFRATLLGVFAAIALLLAVIGIHGVMAYSVAQRTQEIGIRLAMGATKADVLRLVVGQGLTLALAGIGIGLAGAFWLVRLLRSFLYGIGTTDAVTFLAIPAIFLTAAFVACYLPARRAMRVDPVVALRSQ